MELLTGNGLDFYAKGLVALTGLVAAFLKLKETFSIIKRKQELKLDLEIYELLKKNMELEAAGAKLNLQKKLSSAFSEPDERLANFFMGLIVFIGFGLWSIDIYQSNVNFNGWIMLTALCSVTGLSMILGTGKTPLSKGVFYKVGLFDKSNFRVGFIITIVTGILMPILLIKIQGFSFWLFFDGVFFIIGLRSIIQNIRRID